MSRILVVARREFRQRVMTRGFIIGTLGLPLIFVAYWVFTGGAGGAPPERQTREALQELATPDGTIGYVDRSGVIGREPGLMRTAALRGFYSVLAADEALQRGEIDAYYIVSADYSESGDVERVSHNLPLATPDRNLFAWFMVANLIPDADPATLARLREPMGPSGLRFASIADSEEPQPTGGLSLAPLIVTLAILLPLFTSGGFLFQSLNQEKTSRVMEILLVSLRPRDLLTGKLIGLGALTMLQYAVWGAIGLVAGAIAGAGVTEVLSEVEFSAREALAIVPYAVGGYTLYAGLMAGIGAMAKDMESSRVWVFVITLPMMLPIYLWATISEAPNSPLAIALSLFPFSSPATMVMRMTSATVPTWQLVTSGALLAITAVGTVWGMGRLFRAQTLLSGEPLSLGRLWSALRSA